MMELEPEHATLLAAVIAAVASIITLAFTLASKRGEESRAAHRAVIVGELKIVGRALHEVLALSNIQLKAIKKDIHPERYKAAAQAARALKAVRLDVRYTLWGLDSGFRELARLPDWIGHAKVDEKAANEIFALGKALGEDLDRAVRAAYVNGQTPNAWQRFRVERRTHALRKRYQMFSSARAGRIAAPPP